MRLVNFSTSIAGSVLISPSLRCWAVPAISWLALSSFAALAQAPPSAGSLLQQIERDRVAPAPLQVAPQSPVVQTPQRTVTGPTVVVSEFVFTGNTVLHSDQLRKALLGYLGRPLGFVELQAAAAEVAQVYREAGWVVQTYLPEQSAEVSIATNPRLGAGASPELTEATGTTPKGVKITIQIVEALFGSARVNEPVHLRMDTSLVLKMVERAQAPGALIRVDAIDRAMLLIGDLPGVAASATLVPGKTDKTTDLLLALADGPLLNGDVAGDNAGGRSTGALRASANLALNGPFRRGDLFTTNLLHTQGSDYVRLGASLPVGTDGWRVGVNAAHLAYRVTASDFAALNAHGTSTSVGAEATYPLVRANQHSLTVGLSADSKRLSNQSAGATTTQYAVNTWSVAFNGSQIDTFGGGGANRAQVALVGGQVNLNGSPNQAADAATSQVAGRFAKLRYLVSRQQALSGEAGLYAQLSGQTADKNLDASEKFYLGGANGVRAYPANEGGGSEGQMVNLELRRNLPGRLGAMVFYDWGHVTLNHNNGFTGAAPLNSYSLQGYGLGANWAPLLGLNLRMVWAHRVGSNPNPTATGRDQDGTLSKSRFWLSATQSF